MILEKVTAGPLNTNAYLVGSGGVACIIDPAPDSFGRLNLLIGQHEVSLQAIYLTHSHFDHFADAHLVVKKYNTPLYVHGKDAENVEKPGSDGIANIFGIKGVKPTGLLKEGDVIPLGDTSFRVIETPGHTPGGICFYFESEKVLFSGDTLFKGTYGRVDFPTASEEAMYKSLENLIKLPGETVVYPGHGGLTTIEKAKEWICRLW